MNTKLLARLTEALQQGYSVSFDGAWKSCGRADWPWQFAATVENPIGTSSTKTGGSAEEALTRALDAYGPIPAGARIETVWCPAHT